MPDPSTRKPLLGLAHLLAAATAVVTIAGFMVTTIAVELMGTPDKIADIKIGIARLLPILIVAMAVLGGSGVALAPRPIAGRAATKLRRMKIVAPNGLLILIPAALFLAWKASTATFDTAFYVVQAVELVAGAVNLVLLVANGRDGFALTKRRRTNRG